VAGLMRDGIADRIRAEMAHRFPNVPAPQLDVQADGAVAYSYLQASVKFEHPFFENDKLFEFMDSSGKKSAVGSFGIRKKDNSTHSELRQQLRILYRHDDESVHEVREFIIDPCTASRPFQVLLARLERKSTLAETLADIETKIATVPARELGTMIRPNDTFLVPNLAWQINHRFAELEDRDKRIMNPGLEGLYLDTAMQSIRFRLDRSGAELASETKLIAAASPSSFHLDRPFLVLMKKRNGKQPFFVMWVDNAELLQKK
jgi:hypothetical protein